MNFDEFLADLRSRNLYQHVKALIAGRAAGLEAMTDNEIDALCMWVADQTRDYLEVGK